MCFTKKLHMQRYYADIQHGSVFAFGELYRGKLPFLGAGREVRGKFLRAKFVVGKVTVFYNRAKPETGRICHVRSVMVRQAIALCPAGEREGFSCGAGGADGRRLIRRSVGGNIAGHTERFAHIKASFGGGILRPACRSSRRCHAQSCCFPADYRHWRKGCFPAAARWHRPRPCRP